ncbi:hypothetical protein Trydic_g13246 [Trypoxylus dichotomus]
MCSRWVSKITIGVHKTQQHASTLTFLTRYSVEGDEFLNSIATGDETWVYRITLESKQQTIEWSPSNPPKDNNSNQLCQQEKSCALGSVTDRTFCLLSFLPEVKPAMRKDTVEH